MMVLLLFILSFDEVLLLKNGQKIHCEQYEETGAHLTIHRKGKILSLPASLVDWPATHALKEKRSKAAAQETVETAAEDPKDQHIAPKWAEPPRGPIVLNTRDLKKGKTTTRKAGPIEIPFRKVGNSIIVEVTLNAGGPYMMILDTGASVTMINTRSAGVAGLPLKKSSKSVVGVGGLARGALESIASEIALGDAVVNDLRIMVYDIPSLDAIGAIGLLGQDFLNHFVMNLDSSNNRVTLTPHDRAVSQPSPMESDVVGGVNKAIKLHDRFGKDLANIFTEMSNHYSAFNNKTAADQKDRSRANAMRDLSSKLDDLRIDLDAFFSALENIPINSLSEADQSARQRLLGCRVLFEKVLRESKSACRDLRHAFDRNDTPTKLQAGKKEIYTKLNDLQSMMGEVSGCYK